MSDWPETLDAFHARFATEDACAEFLFNWRWPEGFVCPACGGRAHTRLATRRIWQCRACRRQTSLTAGTAMQHTKVALRTWVHALWLLGRPDQRTSARAFQRLAGLGRYETALYLLHKVRSTLANPEKRRLDGQVEQGGTWLTARELRDPVDGPVLLAAVARSGTARAVADLGAPFSDTVLAPTAETLWYGPWIRAFFGEFCAWLSDTHRGVTARYLPRYLDEHVYRSNRRRLGWGTLPFLARRVLAAAWAPARPSGLRQPATMSQWAPA